MEGRGGDAENGRGLLDGQRSPSARAALGSKQGIFQCRRRLATRPPRSDGDTPWCAPGDRGCRRSRRWERGPQAGVRADCISSVRIAAGRERGTPDQSAASAPPFHRRARRAGLCRADFDNDFLEERPQQLLPVARSCGRGVRNGGETARARADAALILGERRWTRLFAARKLGLGGLERAQALLPFALEAASRPGGCRDRRRGSGARRLAS